jgi:hypothetical protein
VSAGLVAAPGAVAAQPAFLYMGSQPGEYIGAGAEWRYTHANARFQAAYGRVPADPSSISIRISIRIDETADGHGPWSVDLGARGGVASCPARTWTPTRMRFATGATPASTWAATAAGAASPGGSW